MTETVPDTLFDLIAADAGAESALWASMLRPPGDRVPLPVFSPLCNPRFAFGLETIYEGYLAHYGETRLFVPPDVDTALLLGDYLYAHGLVRIAETRDVAAVRDLAELISLCAQARAEGTDGEGQAWAATAARLGRGELESAMAALRERGDAMPLDATARRAAGDEAVDRALAAHVALVGTIG
jgi:hypothetical protein